MLIPSYFSTCVYKLFFLDEKSNELVVDNLSEEIARLTQVKSKRKSYTNVNVFVSVEVAHHSGNIDFLKNDTETQFA